VVSVRAVVALVVVAVASAGGWWLGEQRHTANPRARVIDVLDGDTVVVAFADGSTDTIRLLGVDTPNLAEQHLPPVIDGLPGRRGTRVPPDQLGVSR